MAFALSRSVVDSAPLATAFWTRSRSARAWTIWAFQFSMSAFDRVTSAAALSASALAFSPSASALLYAVSNSR